MTQQIELLSEILEKIESLDASSVEVLMTRLPKIHRDKLTDEMKIELEQIADSNFTMSSIGI